MTWGSFIDTARILGTPRNLCLPRLQRGGWAGWIGLGPSPERRCRCGCTEDAELLHMAAAAVAATGPRGAACEQRKKFSNGYWYREVVQRREGVRVHRAG